MKRILLPSRQNWKDILEKREGFLFHTVANEPYWAETMENPACYQFTLDQIESIEDAGEQMHKLCLEAVEYVINNKLLGRFNIPEKFWDAIERSWVSFDGALYGRFDFSYDGVNPPKLLEYNADTPTSLFEAAFVQWNWMEDMIEEGYLPKGVDQFNRIQEDLIERLQVLNETYGRGKPWHFSSCKNASLEDESTVYYLMDLAKQAGIDPRFCYIEDIGLGIDASGQKSLFLDLEVNAIENWFKLYPWEWIFSDEYGERWLEMDLPTFEPIWKAILSNKAILPILYKLNPDNPHILPAFFEDEFNSSTMSDYVVKPILSREGANIEVNAGFIREQSKGLYDDCPRIIQAFHALPCFEGNYPVIGCWMVDGKASGMGVREDDSVITKDTSRFIPHIILN